MAEIETRFSPEFSSPTLRANFLARCFETAKWHSRNPELFSETGQLNKTLYQKEIKPDIRRNVDVFMAQNKGKNLRELSKLKVKDLKEYLQNSDWVEEQEIPRYLILMEKMLASTRGIIQYRAMDFYVNQMHKDDVFKEDFGQGLRGAALLARKASEIRKKHLGTGEKSTTFVKLIQQEIDSRNEKLKKAIARKAKTIAPQKEGQMDDIKKILHLIPRLPAIRKYRKTLSNFWDSLIRKPVDLKRAQKRMKSYFDLMTAEAKKREEIKKRRAAIRWSAF